jgi:beta-lactam-binding protein with PASTA domain
VPPETEAPRAETTVPADLINKSLDAAQAQLSAAGIPFSTSFREVEDTQVGVVLEVDPVGGTVLTQGDGVRLLAGKTRESSELRVPADFVNRTADAAGQQLSAAGIPFTTSFVTAGVHPS